MKVSAADSPNHVIDDSPALKSEQVDRVVRLQRVRPAISVETSDNYEVLWGPSAQWFELLRSAQS